MQPTISDADRPVTHEVCKILRNSMESKMKFLIGLDLTILAGIIALLISQAVK